MRHFILYVFFLFPLASAAQQPWQRHLDSLEDLLPSIKEDTFKVQVLHYLSKNYNTIDPNEGIKYGLAMLDLATRMGRKKNIIAAYTVLGMNYKYKSDYAKALEYFNKAMIICSEKDEPALYAGIARNLAPIWQEMGHYDKALEYNLKSLKYSERGKDSATMAGDLGNIGIVYLLKKDYEKALEYDFRSLKIFELLNDKDGIAHNYGNIGNVYKEFGNYVLALEHDVKALNIFKELGDLGGMAINLGNIGAIYGETVIASDSGNKNGKILPRGSRSQLLLLSIRYFEQSIALSRQIEQLENIMEFSQGLSEAYRMKGDHQKALENYQTYIQYKDSLHSDENRLRLANLETEREQGLKEKQIQINELEKTKKIRERIIYSLALAILIIVIAVVTGKFMRQKRRNRLLAQERKRHLERIEQQKIVMGDIAYAHSHDVSGQVATILGLADVFNTANYSDPDNKVVIDGIADTAKKLDIIVKDMIIKENVLNKGRKG